MFFKRIASQFGTGLVTVLPFALVIWVLVTIFKWVDGLLGPRVNHIMGKPVPGVGFVLIVLGITLAGFLTRLYVSHRIYLLMDSLFAKIPFVKSLYSMFKELVESLVRQRQGFTRVVLVEWPDERAQVIGLVTRESLPESIDPTGRKLSVYLPNTFQFAGLTVLVERDRVQPCTMSVEEAFKFTVSAGFGQQNVPSLPIPQNGQPPAADI